MFCEKCGGELCQEENKLVCTKCGAEFAQEISSENSVTEEVGVYVTPRGFSSKKHIIAIIIAAIVAVVTVTVVVVNLPKPEQSPYMGSGIEVAERFLWEQKYEQAVIEFEKVLEIEPMNVDAYLGLADAYIGLGDKEKALEILRKGLELTGDERVLARLFELTATSSEGGSLSEKKNFEYYRTRTIAASGGSTIAVLNDGSCVCVGPRSYYNFTKSKGNIPVVSVDCQADTFAWVYADGTVNGAGNCGGYVSEDNFTDIVDIAIGFLLHSDGTVSISRLYCEDDEYYKPVLSWNDVVMIESEEWVVGIKSDGTVVAAGYDIDAYLSEISKWTDIVDVAISGRCIAGLKRDGTVLLAGELYEGMADALSWSNIVSIDINQTMVAGLDSNGRVLCTSGEFDKFDTSSWSDIVEIALDNEHIVGLKSDGTLVTIVIELQSEYLAVNECSSLSNVKQVYSSLYNNNYCLAVALKNDGTVSELGFHSSYCHMLEEYTIKQLSENDNYTIIWALTSDGGVVSSRDSWQEKEEWNNWTDIKAIADGLWIGEAIAIRKDGTVAWALRNDTSDEYRKEREAFLSQLNSWTNIEKIYCNSGDIIGVKTDGTCVAISEREGFNKDSFGDYSSEYEYLNSLKNVDSICGQYVILKDGSYIEPYGRDIVKGANCQEVIPLNNNLLILHKDGTLSWETSNANPANKRQWWSEAENWTDIIDISLNGNGSLLIGLKSDGTVVSCGFNADGQFSTSLLNDIKMPIRNY